MKAKGKKTPRAGKKNNLKSLMQAGDPSKKLLAMGIPNMITLLCNSDTEKRLHEAIEVLQKIGFPIRNLYELLDTLIKGTSARKSPSDAGKASARSREAKFDWWMIQEEANKIWTKFPSFSKSQVVERVHSVLEQENIRTGEKIPTPGTIRQKISYPKRDF